MIRNFLIPLLSSLIFNIFAAEPEVITMTDGRVLIGEFTPKSLHLATVALVKPKGAVITISPDDIKSREPYIPPPETAKVEDKSDPAKHTERPKDSSTKPQVASIPKNDRLSQLALEIEANQRQVRELNAKIGGLQNEYNTIIYNTGKEFILHGDLDPVAISLPAKPTNEESAKAKRAFEFNNILTTLSTELKSSKQEPWRLDRAVSMLNANFWDLYLEFKNIPRPY